MKSIISFDRQPRGRIIVIKINKTNNSDSYCESKKHNFKKEKVLGD